MLVYKSVRHRGCRFFWSRSIGDYDSSRDGGYYIIWKTHHSMPGIARMVIHAPFAVILREFLKQNNRWH